jgi:hypothetical protein
MLTLILEFSASRTVRQYISIVEAHQSTVFGNESWNRLSYSLLESIKQKLRATSLTNELSVRRE